MKLHCIEGLETKLCKAEIEKRLEDIVLKEKFFNINTDGKKLCRAEYKENTYSFFYLSGGRHDMLSPQIHMTILEKERGCICNLSYSRTWEFLCLFIWWSIFIGICICVNVLKFHVFNLICYIVVYVLGIWIAQRHCDHICTKVLNILKSELN